MKKISLINKILFFWDIRDLSDEIDIDFNRKTKTFFQLSFIFSLYLFNKFCLDYFISNVNFFFRVILLLLYFYAFVQILYLVTLKMYDMGYR
ncbi:hypothetical protein [Clostridium sp. B9]|uniref:hypothetical protein n=1 Tax=Clostridium sp. B9 TaxID=3423224 RepID=UPI003D2F4CD9